MFKQKLYRSLIVLAMLVCTFTIWSASTPSVHAAGITVHTTTKTQIMKAPAKLCAFLKKSAPTYAGNPHLCDFKYTSTDVVYTQNSGAQSLVTPFCASVTAVHKYTYTEFPGVYSFTQIITFHWNDGCGNITSLYNHDCHSMWSIPPYVLSPNRCIQENSGAEATAEDDVNVGSYVGGTYVAAIYTRAFEGGASAIQDWWS